MCLKETKYYECEQIMNEIREYYFGKYMNDHSHKIKDNFNRK